MAVAAKKSSLPSGKDRLGLLLESDLPVMTRCGMLGLSANF